MADVLAESLRADVASGRLVVIAGAGVSIAASNSADLASWVGLLKNGIEVAFSVGQPLPSAWKELTEAELDMAINDHYTPGFISVAEKITAALGGRSAGEFRRWLSESVGALELTDPAVPQALAGLGAPIATTNYDDLLERSLSMTGVTWLAPTQAQNVLSFQLNPET